MTVPQLVLHQHPFASFCWKPLIALHELGLPFASHLVLDAADREELAELWPLAKIPVLRVVDEDLTLPESTTIVEHLDGLSESGPRLIPDDPTGAREARLWDRVIDAYVTLPMQAVVADALREEGTHDPTGVAASRAMLDQAYRLLDDRLEAPERVAPDDTPVWLAGPSFTLADCAAAPALFYGRVVHPWDEEAHPALTRYLGALLHRPSVARVVDDARPYRPIFPLGWPDHADDHGPRAVAEA
jgi:glutathione S-transferase